MNRTAQCASRLALPLVAAVALALAFAIGSAAQAQQGPPPGSPPHNNHNGAGPNHTGNHPRSGQPGKASHGRPALPARNAHPGEGQRSNKGGKRPPTSTPHRTNVHPVFAHSPSPVHHEQANRNHGAYPPPTGGAVPREGSNNSGGRQRQNRQVTHATRQANPRTNARAKPTTPVYAKSVQGQGRPQLAHGVSPAYHGSLATHNAQTHAGSQPQHPGGATSFTAPNGAKTTLGGATTVTEANGKKVTLGGASSFAGPNGEHYANGVTHQSQRNANGVNSQGDFQGGLNINNGGTGGDAESAPEYNKELNPLADKNGTTTSDNGTLQWKDGKKWSGTDSDGAGWKNGKQWSGPDGNGGFYTNGHHVVGTKNSTGGTGDDPDIGAGRDGGQLYSGTGKRADPGHHLGQDGGNGPDTGAAPTGGGSNRNNANGHYVATHTNGQDVPAKVKETGPMTTNYNGRKGVTDPKKTAGTSGG